ncbi:transcriptional regulator [Novimethylophilus kurashikiensis]|uniref:Transcriptional regulator n=1 Tax=Novimethylophilus kurashikiensis TaxID=1825523 RepID=A0A2R5F3Y9_9PROT|nr:hypothetical protein [Novimethylophilus kurashikiensis]GBG13152.1 transcriptional regulator [Novimethylophilus kurashikiensis]
MHTNKIYFAFALLTTLSACATPTPELDSHFGDAVNAAKAQQTLNPDASQNTAPVTGMDGKAANSAVDRYEKTFEKPQPTENIFNIGVGTSNSSSSGGGR